MKSNPICSATVTDTIHDIDNDTQEITRVYFKDRPCRGTAKYKFLDGTLLCFAHGCTRLRKEAIASGDIIDMSPENNNT